MRGLRMACVMVAMAAKSPSEAIAKPASIMSTPKVLKSMSHSELLLRGHAATRRLFAIAQSGVKEHYMVRCHRFACLEAMPTIQCLASCRYKAKLLLLGTH